MMDRNVYSDIVEHYYGVENDLKRFRKEVAILTAKIDAYEGLKADLSYILSKYGRHVFDHFEEDIPEQGAADCKNRDYETEKANHEAMIQKAREAADGGSSDSEGL